MEDESKNITQNAAQRDKAMETMTDSKNVEGRMRSSNLRVFRIQEQMNGEAAIFKEIIAENQN